MLYPLGGVPQLCRNRLEDISNLYHTILLPIVVQKYEFHGKSESLKMQTSESPLKSRKNNK